jgi:hypothetical protein
MSETDIRELLMEAAQNPSYFSDTAVANRVAQFLLKKSDEIDLMKVSFRTLKMGYDFAKTHSETWQDLFLHVLPRPSTKPPIVENKKFFQKEEPQDQILELLHSPLSVKEKQARFISLTGKSRRTFYNYKRQFGLSRSYRSNVTHPF